MDTEFLGDVKAPHTCRLWDICLVMLSPTRNMEVFQAVVDPCPGMEVFMKSPPGYFTPTRAFLDANMARPLHKVLRAMVRWVRARSGDTVPVFAAHGAFRADKPVMEMDAARVGFRLPSEWMWADTLYVARDTFRGLRDYSLQSLVEKFVNGNYVQTHRARDDAIALTMIVQKTMPLKGPIYKTYQIPLRSLKGLGGKSELQLMYAGVLTGEVLINCLTHIGRQNPTNPTAALHWLARIVGNTNAYSILKLNKQLAAAF